MRTCFVLVLDEFQAAVPSIRIVYSLNVQLDTIVGKSGFYHSHSLHSSIL